MAYRNQNICRMQRSPRLMRPDSGHNQAISAADQQVALDSLLNMCEIVIDYIMSQYPSPPPGSGNKRDRLQRSGTLNPHPERVRDSAFQVEGFFDPLDLLQVRYEMVRLVRLGRPRWLRRHPASVSRVQPASVLPRPLPSPACRASCQRPAGPAGRTRSRRRSSASWRTIVPNTVPPGRAS